MQALQNRRVSLFIDLKMHAGCRGNICTFRVLIQNIGN